MGAGGECGEPYKSLWKCVDNPKFEFAKGSSGLNANFSSLRTRSYSYTPFFRSPLCRSLRYFS